MEKPQEYQVRLEKLRELRDMGINPYPHSFSRTHLAREVHERYEELEGKETRLAGRLLVKRRFGKILFAHIRDESGEVQIYLDAETEPLIRGENPVRFFDRFFDPGDFVGITGTPFKTKTGEKTIKVKRYEMLAKSLLPLPEKWHGVRDPELAYRDRPLFLIANPDEKAVFLRRAKIIQIVRDFFHEKGFVEFETPALQPLYGGAAARPFRTRSWALDAELFLRIADELYLKRLLVAGYERVFEICKDFRNEGIDRTHYPEFTMLEAYASFWDYNDMMELAEELLNRLALELTGSETVQYQGKILSFRRPFKRLDYTTALSEILGIDVMSASDAEIMEVAERYGVENPKTLHRAKLIDKLFDIAVGERITDPTFVLDHPRIMSPLAKPHRARDGLVERFELFVMGTEIANSFTELNDPLIQRENMERDAALRDEELPSEVDEEFLTALERGMPPTGGIGIGMDRLAMIFTDKPSIRDVIVFPQLRPK
ncbi:MAG: lysine--tRNA ligase [candidate division WOR-3 bacterium]